MRNGDICYVSFEGTGTEITGSHPAIILKIFSSANLAIVIPLTTNLEVLANYPLTQIIRASSQSGLSSDSVAELFHIRSCHLSRIQVNRNNERVVIGKISAEERKIINDMIHSELQFP